MQLNRTYGHFFGPGETPIRFVIRKQALGFHGNDRFRYRVVTVRLK